MVKDIRYRPVKYTKKVISKELYNKWIKENPEYSKYSFKEFYNFWKLLANEYKKNITTNTHGIRLSFYMGDISLKYVTSTDINKNYKSSKEAGVDVGHLNFITSGKNGKVVWSVNYARKFNSELPLIGFQPCRNLTEMATEAFRESPELFRITKVSKSNIESILLKHHPNYFREK